MEPQPPPASAPAQRNGLALVSFSCGLYTLASLALFAVAVGFAFPHAGHPLSRLSQALLAIAGPVGFLFFPATIIALVTGIVAVRRARALPPNLALRGRAWVGLLLGALGSVGVLLTLVTLIAFVAASILQNR